ncbi:YfhO family protein [Tenacibaculum maritimum]|uniref:YfhO family protein n=1 Tax=Tenacibaculum maritimum TaxID=107401 RepID=UPI0004000255|nr:YfhO family protein [Tenacibaculum maritimum]
MKLNKFIPYIIAVAIFAIASLIYFKPVLSGKGIKQGDITQFIGMSKELNDYRAKNNKEPYWIGSAFSGMPSYQVSAYYPNDFIKYVDKALRFLPRPADYLFLYFIGFFILLIVLKVDWKLAIIGALSFGLSTYLIIIFGAGHNAKAHAIAYMPVVIAGVLLVFQKRYLLGFLVTGIAMGLEINTNHPQMTYYLGFILLILGIVELIEAIKVKKQAIFIQQAAIILTALVLGLGLNATRLLSMKEYADYSTRSSSELTITPDGSPKKKSTGLSNEYITEYSYGIAETFNLFIPRFMGGGTIEKLEENSETHQFLAPKVGVGQAKYITDQAFTYWGTQPIVEAPAYIGAIVCFLFFLGIFLIQGKIKHWLVAATIFSIIMSWGKNFSILTNLFIDYFPLYNKFRAVSSIQVIAELCIPLLGILALKKFLSSEVSLKEKEGALKKAAYISGGIALFFALFGTSLFTFEGLRDGQYLSMEKEYGLNGLLDAIMADRKSMLFDDSVRSLLLVAISVGTLWFFLKGKIKQIPVFLILGVLIIVDLVSVDKRYVNEEDFTTIRKVQKPFTASKADQQILKDKTYYRVGNFTTNPMMDGSTSYFHKSIGGYHAAKMRRYQELFDYQIAKNNREVLNMLNTKYLIVGEEEVQENPAANGNAWFVEKVIIVNSADEEIKALSSINTKKEAVYNKNLSKENVEFPRTIDTTATIVLEKYSINELVYKSVSKEEQFAVFSEIYYKDGWKAYIDGKETPYYNVNYVLRGLVIPKGNHTIRFTFEPTIIKEGNTITLLSYALLFIIPIGWYFVRKKKTT